MATPITTEELFATETVATEELFSKKETSPIVKTAVKLVKEVGKPFTGQVPFVKETLSTAELAFKGYQEFENFPRKKLLGVEDVTKLVPEIPEKILGFPSRLFIPAVTPFKQEREFQKQLIGYIGNIVTSPTNWVLVGSGVLKQMYNVTQNKLLKGVTNELASAFEKGGLNKDIANKMASLKVYQEWSKAGFLQKTPTSIQKTAKFIKENSDEIASRIQNMLKAKPTKYPVPTGYPTPNTFEEMGKQIFSKAKSIMPELIKPTLPVAPKIIPISKEAIPTTAEEAIVKGMSAEEWVTSQDIYNKSMIAVGERRGMKSIYPKDKRMIIQSIESAIKGKDIKVLEDLEAEFNKRESQLLSEYEKAKREVKGKTFGQMIKKVEVIVPEHDLTDEDFWGEKIAKLVKDPRNPTQVEWAKLDKLYKKFMNKEKYDEWDNAKKVAEKIARERGDIKTWPSEAKPKLPIVTPETIKTATSQSLGIKPSAFEFKIKPGEQWEIPSSEEKKFKAGKFIVSRPKKMTSEKAIEEITQSLKEQGIPFEVTGEEEEYIKISPAHKLPKAPSGEAMAGTWNNKIPVELGTEIYKLKPVEFPELVSLAKDLIGDYPTLKNFPKVAGKFYGIGKGQIKLTPELFQRGKEQQLSIVLAHEIGHLTDYLPEHTLKRGNLLGRLLTLQGYMKNTFGAINITNKEIKDELWKVTQHLHPYNPDEATPAYNSYRKSSRELYAEAISLLLNSPGTIEKLAPEFVKIFFDNLDKKIEVKEAYFNLQELLSGKPEDVLKKRQEDIRRMFVKGKDLREYLENKKKLERVSLWEKMRSYLDDVNRPILKKIEEQEAKGIITKEGEDIKSLLQEKSLVDIENFLLVADIDNVVIQPLQKQGLNIDSLEEYLFLKRIIGSPDITTEQLKTVIPNIEAFSEEELNQIKKIVEGYTGRKDIANPLGFAPATARAQLSYLKEQIGNEKFAVLEGLAQKFHDIIFKSVEEAVRVGSYNMKVFKERIEPQKNIYVTYGVLEYLQNYVPATVKKMKGTLKEVESPFITTILKIISLNKLNAKQRALNEWRDYWFKNFPNEITKSKEIRLGEGISRIIEPPKGSGLGSVKLLEDGKLVSYDVDEYIAESFSNSKIGDVELGMILNRFLGNQIFKNLYITYNPGFAFAFNPIRDFKRTYINLNALGEKVTIKKLMLQYVKNLPDAIKRQKGITEGTVREMMENKALDIPFIDFNYDIKNDSYYHILERLNLLEGKEHYWRKLSKTILNPITKTLEAIRFGGSVIESLPKIAGYNLLDKKQISDRERSYITRNYIGTPNYRVKGKVTSTTNAIFIFSNIFKEGLKTDLMFATKPSTRGGWWWANMKVNLMPKFLMFLAGSGVLGLALKDFYDKVSEYDKTNYIIIPLGIDSDNKAVYMRIPHDETGRLISGIMWKMLNVLKGEGLKQFQQVFSFAGGQLPGRAPAINIMASWFNYLSGKNPYDAFRGRYLVSDTVWKAGGFPALKKMVQWTFNQTGLAQFTTYDDKEKSTFDIILQLTPIVNRLFKSSDYGLTEKLTQIKEQEQQESARMTLLKRDVYKRSLDRFKKGEPINIILKDIKKGIYGQETISKQKETALKKGFVKTILQELDNPYIDALTYATTNDEKVKILLQMKETKSPQEILKVINLLRKTHFISNEVIQNYKKELVK